MGPFRSVITLVAATLLFAATNCGATESERTLENEPAPSAEPPGRQDDSPAEAPSDEAEAEAPEVVEAPPEHEPTRAESVVVVPGEAFGPIRLGMSRDEVAALGLEAEVVDPRTTRFGPYDVTFDDRGARRIAARIGAIGSASISGRDYESGVHIREMRDGIGGCEWQEGGGEIYRCADGGLFVQTTHSMRPDRYEIVVTRVR